MRQPSKAEIAYRALERLESGQMSDDSVAQLQQALNGTTSLLVSKAADIAAARGLRDLIPSMVDAFDRLMPGGAKADKNCSAKISIANALNELEHTDDEVFVAGAYHVQMEPAFGGPIDTAIKLRCACAYGLARIGRPEAHYVLTDLLADGEAEVRAAAAKALTYMGTPESEVLLRFKVLTDDNELDVITECFAGLLTMSPTRSLDFVARYLKSNDLSMLESAALAIGQSRSPRAYDVLRQCWDDNASPSARQALLLPIALVRTDEAFDFLLEIVRKGSSKTAVEAVSALGLYADDSSVRRIRETVNDRGDAETARAFERGFGA